jgi:hypothetical protein
LETGTIKKPIQEQASNISVKGNKIRFQIPDVYSRVKGFFVIINGLRVYHLCPGKDYTHRSYRYESDLHTCWVETKRNFVYRLSHIKDGQALPVTQNIEEKIFIDDADKTLEKIVGFSCYKNEVAANFDHALERYFPKSEWQTYALRVSIGRFDILHVRHVLSMNPDYDGVVETSYAKDGKLLWINGFVNPSHKSIKYTVRFSPDGLTARAHHEIETGITPATAEFIDRYMPYIRAFCKTQKSTRIDLYKSMTYVAKNTALPGFCKRLIRHISSVSPGKLQRDFDLYKRNATLVEFVEGRW